MNPRLPPLAPAGLDTEQRELYDAIAGGPRSQGRQGFPLIGADGALTGPFNAMLLRPRLGAALQALGAAVRYQTRLDGRSREIAILVVASLADSAFERYAHEAVGRQAGLTETDLAAIRDGRYGELNGGYERTVARTVATLVRVGDLDDGQYADAVRQLGIETVFELLTLVGYYLTLALQLRVFRVAVPAPADPARKPNP
ncbi:MAG TPA: carboxymuconolactone decarboxylase family protein [Rugosimonospora sp.]|nr:carboxymuconolactone decarboxylase family protein [Rugosimonospora sp.]